MKKQKNNWKMIKELIKKFKFEEIGEPPYEYDLLISLKESEYPRYLKKMFKGMTGQELNLNKPKTFNEKIQWLKLYDSTPLKTKLTDKVLVRDWVKDKIGGEYLKPVLWVGSSFDEIPFDDLPEQFIIKANHGCKWHFKIKNKEKFLKDQQLYNQVKAQFNGWMNQTFFPWAGFEMQYKGIIPKLLIEPLLLDAENQFPVEYEVYCFNGKAEIFQKIQYKIPAQCCVYNSDYSISEIRFNPYYTIAEEAPDEYLKHAAALSTKLSEDFKLVRVDWLKYRDNIYFNEMTFTPYSGFFIFENPKWNEKLGKLLKL